MDAYLEQGSLAMNKPMPEPFSQDDVHLLERLTEVFAIVPGACLLHSRAKEAYPRRRWVYPMHAKL